MEYIEVRYDIIAVPFTPYPYQHLLLSDLKKKKTFGDSSKCIMDRLHVYDP